MFIQHTDNKAEQERLLCLPDGWADPLVEDADLEGPSDVYRSHEPTLLTHVEHLKARYQIISVLFVLIILAHDRQRTVHVAVTAHPTATWTAQQLREAFPTGRAPHGFSFRAFQR